MSHKDALAERLAEAERLLRQWLDTFPDGALAIANRTRKHFSTADSASRPMQPAEQRECADITAHGVLCLRSLTRAPVDGCDCDRCRAASSASGGRDA